MSVAAALATHDRLIGSAIEVIARKGYDGASVGEIARGAGLTTGAIYSRFGSKQALMAAVSEQLSVTELSRLLEDPTRPFAAELRRTGEELLSAPESPEHWALLDGLVAARRDPTLAHAMRERLEHGSARLRAAVHASQEIGELDDELDPDVIAHWAQMTAIGSLVLQSVGVERPDDDAWRKMTARVFEALGASGKQQHG